MPDTSTADSTLSTKEKADGTTADASTVLKDISSLDTDITDEVDAGTAGDSSRTVTETPGEAVLAGASTYMAQARIDREQIRSQNKDRTISSFNVLLSTCIPQRHTKTKVITDFICF